MRGFEGEEFRRALASGILGWAWAVVEFFRILYNEIGRALNN